MRSILRSHTGSVCLGLTIALFYSAACGSSPAPPNASTEQSRNDDGGQSSLPIALPGNDDGGDASAIAEDASPLEDGDAGAVGAADPNGVYIAPTGSDSAAGTAAAPFATIKEGVAIASAEKRTLYVCAATFTENVLITSGITIDGGYDCANGWAPTTNFANIAPSSGVPLTINSGSAPVSISNVKTKAPDNYASSGSSIGAFVVNSTAVVLQHVQLTSGNAGDGEPAAPPSTQTTPAPSGANGASLPDFGCTPGEGGECNGIASGGNATNDGCYGQGGVGGNGGDVVTGMAPETGGVGLPTSSGGQGGPANASNGQGAGLPGSIGITGSAGSPATSGIGTVTAAGYVASNSGSGGSPGQAGGGGGGGAGGYSGSSGQLCSIDFLGGGGGQGGFGGCGGPGGAGGSAGGASIALLTFNSAVQLSDAILNTGNGGDGASSTEGAAGQPGGQGGPGGAGSHGDNAGGDCTNSSTSGNAYGGGPGGQGGKGGAGGPGGGGPSIGILAMNTAPQVSTATYNVGSGGSGGTAITGPDATDGQTGELVVLGTGAGAQWRKGE